MKRVWRESKGADAVAYLVLQNGKVFEGRRMGARMDRVGELVFTTGVVGYLETLTDPSYCGQIVTHAFPQIGNYGVIGEDFEGESALSGYIVRELCRAPSNFRSQGTLNDYLFARGIPGLCGIDTRAVVQTVREAGVMNALICDEIPSDLTFLREYRVTNAVASVTCREKRVYPAKGREAYRVALMDYGAKQNIIRELQSRACRVTVWPADTPAETVLSEDPDGIMLSNGPGDPKDNGDCIREVRKMIGQKPVFGICLGHQLVALALGGDTVKLKYGHRGANQPVRDISSGRVWTTSQNHGYAVVAQSLEGIGRPSFINANDQSCEGMDYPDHNCFTVQFHPEACSGPWDTVFLFDRFIDMMRTA